MPQWLQEVGKNLQTLPDEIAAVSTEMNTLLAKISDAEERFTLREHDIFNAVSTALDPTTNKPAFSNKELRDGETHKRTKTDPECVEIAAELKALRDERDKLRVKGTLLSDKFSATKHRADLFASWFRASL